MKHITGADSAELWEFNDVDLAKVAGAIGAYGLPVDHPGDIQGALNQALDSGSPAVVDVATDPMDSEAPIPWAP